jgi:glucose-6-phosphate 1-dehydrogenase
MGWRSQPTEDASSGCGTIIEKPFGHDLESAKALNDEVNKVFRRIRSFASTTTWARRRCRTSWSSALRTASLRMCGTATTSTTCEITAAESIGIEGRGPFYEKAGALRDVVQNHVMELLSFVAMEPPVSV